jgi:hypothetical protein
MAFGVSTSFCVALQKEQLVIIQRQGIDLQVAAGVQRRIATLCHTTVKVRQD